MSVEVPAAAGAGEDRALQLFFGRGWKEESILYNGSYGTVSLVRGGAGGAKRSVLKRTALIEVRALQALAQCRNLVTLEETFFCDDCYSEAWVRLEWLRGGDLRTFLHHHDSALVPQETAQFIISEVLLGLKEMHLKGWMHRDVKEDSVGFLTPLVPGSRDCRVKLLDFKSAAELPASGRLTEVVGCPECRAPEVYDASYDDLADCWSLGVLAHRLLLGRRPFEVEEMVRNWRQYLHLPPELPELAARFVRGLLVEREARMSSSEAARHPWFSEGGFLGMGQDPSKAALDGEASGRRRVSLANVPSPARNRRSSGGLGSPGRASEGGQSSARSRRPSGRVRTRVEEYERAAAGGAPRAADFSSAGASSTAGASWSSPPTSLSSPTPTELGQAPVCARCAEELGRLEDVLHAEREARAREAEEARADLLALEEENEELHMMMAEGRAERDAMEAERSVLRRQLDEADYLRQRNVVLEEELRLLRQQQAADLEASRERAAELEASREQAAAAEAERDVLRKRLAKMDEVLERSLMPMQECLSLWKQFSKAMQTQQLDKRPEQERQGEKGPRSEADLAPEQTPAPAARARQSQAPGGGDALVVALERERRALEQHVAEAREAREAQVGVLRQEEPTPKPGPPRGPGTFLWKPRQRQAQAEDAAEASDRRREEAPEAKTATVRPPESSPPPPTRIYPNTSPRRVAATPLPPALEPHTGAPTATSQPASRPTSRPASRPASPLHGLRSPLRRMAPQPSEGAGGSAIVSCAQALQAAPSYSPLPRARAVRWTSPGAAEVVAAEPVAHGAALCQRPGFVASPRGSFGGGTPAVATVRVQQLPMGVRSPSGAVRWHAAQPGSSQSILWEG